MPALSFSCPDTSQHTEEVMHAAAAAASEPAAEDSHLADASLCDLRELTYCYRTKITGDGLRVRALHALRDVRAAIAVCRLLLEREAVEVFGVLCLTTDRTVICWHEVSRGGLDFASFRLREVFKAAIMSNAAALIAAHNHPSGSPTPSAPDIALTEQLVDAGRLLGITVLDHIIVGHQRCVSLRSTRPRLFSDA